MSKFVLMLSYFDLKIMIMCGYFMIDDNDYFRVSNLSMLFFVVSYTKFVFRIQMSQKLKLKLIKIKIMSQKFKCFRKYLIHVQTLLS